MLDMPVDEFSSELCVGGWKTWVREETGGVKNVECCFGEQSSKRCINCAVEKRSKSLKNY